MADEHMEVRDRIVEVLAKYNIRLADAPLDALVMAMERMMDNRRRPIWLRRERDHAIVLVEADGEWREAIREFIESPFSHIWEDRGRPAGRVGGVDRG